jgi:hypothetical protein
MRDPRERPAWLGWHGFCLTPTRHGIIETETEHQGSVEPL